MSKALRLKTLTVLRFITPLLVLITLSSCAAVPNDGPTGQIVASKKEQLDNFPYGLVTLDGVSVAVLGKNDQTIFERGFGFGSAKGSSLIGPGDVLVATIFEGGQDGIFSTPTNKTVNFDFTVQSNGRISIPFDGTVMASGRTLEQIRESILGQLRGRAVDPDVIVNVKTSNSRSVTVNGDVRAAGKITLTTGRERVLDVVAQAGGPASVPFDTYISLSRGQKTKTTQLKTLIEQPRENIYVNSDDSLFLTHDPRSFVALGAVAKKGRLQFASGRMSLIDAVGLSEGLDEARADSTAYFIFRYEDESIVRKLCHSNAIELATIEKLLQNPAVLDDQGRMPVVYRINMNDPDSFFVAQRFEVRNDDILYVARSNSVDLVKVFTILRGATGAVNGAVSVAN